MSGLRRMMYGTGTGAAPISYPKMSLVFDGLDTAGVIPSAIWDAFPVSNSAFTIEHWVKPGSLVGVDSLLVNIAEQASPNGFRTGLYSGDYYAQFGIGGSYLEQPLTGSGWVHLAFTHDPTGNVQKIIKNGTVLETKTGVASWVRPTDPSAHAYSIGANGDLVNNNYDGEMDLTRIWNIVKTPAQLVTDALTIFPPGTTGLAAQYDFATGSGTTLYDTSGNDFHIILSGSPVWNPSTDSPVDK